MTLGVLPRIPPHVLQRWRMILCSAGGESTSVSLCAGTPELESLAFLIIVPHTIYSVYVNFDGHADYSPVRNVHVAADPISPYARVRVIKDVCSSPAMYRGRVLHEAPRKAVWIP